MYVTSPIPHKKARIEIIPLIDIMFFLLASFMMVSLSQVHMKGIKVNLPSGVSGETQTKREYLSVSVDKDGHYFYDKDQVSDDELLNRLRQAHQTAPDAKVFMRGDRESAHLNVAHALDVIRSSGYYKVSAEKRSQSLKGVPGPKCSRYGSDRRKTVDIPAATPVVFLDRPWGCTGNPRYSGRVVAKARGRCSRASSSTAAGRRGDLGATGGHATAGGYSAAGASSSSRHQARVRRGTNTTAAAAAEGGAKIRAD